MRFLLLLRPLAKNALFGHLLPEQAPKMHAPLPSWSPPQQWHGPTRQGKVLIPSKTDPRVRRWQTPEEAADAAPQADHAAKTMRELDARRGEPLYVTRARASHPEIRALEHHGYIRIRAEPAHHVQEFALELTDLGRRHLATQKLRGTLDAKRRQAGLFKAIGLVIRVYPPPATMGT